MPSEAYSLSEAAYHEASHAVVGIALGAWPMWITIEACEDYQAGCQFDTPVHIVDPTRNTEESILRAFAVNAAGLLGQLRFLHDSGAPIDHDRIFHTARTDRRHTQIVIERPYLLPGVDLKALHDRAWTCADETLTGQWPRVEALASKLVEHRTLDKTQIEAAYAHQ
jgi:hypothetical protein